MAAASFRPRHPRGPSPRLRRGRTTHAPEKQPTGHNHNKPHASPTNNRARLATPRQSPRPPEPENRPASPPTLTGAGVGRIDARDPPTPPSILHRNSNFMTALSPGPTFNMSPQAACGARRVQFLSSGSSVASSTASGVHLMAGANSIASSSAMSSSENRENVFDRVRERLNDMGMSNEYPESNYAAGVWRQQQRWRRAGVDKTDRPRGAGRRDSSSGSDDDLGLTPPRDLGPIDMDTGLEVAGSGAEGPIDADTGREVGARQRFGSLHHRAPIDIDSGLEIEEEGDDCEYHDLNDDGVDEQRWKELNDVALMAGVHGGTNALRLDKLRRVRSSPSSSTSRKHPTLDWLPGHNSFGLDPFSDPRMYRRSGSDGHSNGDSWEGDKILRKSPSRTGGDAKKSSKKLWGDGNKDFYSDKWVAFDNHRPAIKARTRTAPSCVSDLAAF